MARRRRSAAGMESYHDLARKLEILEREMAVQQQAISRLKQMAAPPKPTPRMNEPSVRKSA